MTIPIQAGIDYKNISAEITFKDNTIKDITVSFIREYTKPVGEYNAIAEILDKDFPSDVVSKKDSIKEIKLKQLAKTWEVCSHRLLGINDYHKGSVIVEENLPPITAYNLKEI